MLEEYNELELPIFTSQEKEKILSELCTTKFKEVWKIIPINLDWSIEITKDESYSFNTWKKGNRDMALDFLLKIWKVWIYSGTDVDMWHVGFRIVPNRDDIENPYTDVTSSLETAETKKRTDIDFRREQIKLLVESILKEDQILETRREELQDFHFKIAEKVVNWETVERIINDLERI